MKKIFLFLSILLIGCTNNRVKEPEQKIRCCPPTIVFQPCNNFTEKEAQQLAPKVMEFLENLTKVNLEYEILPSIQLSDTLKQNNRYRADKIIKYFKNKSNDHYVIITLIHDDISTTVRGIQDWGILGLSMQPYQTCVVSDFRLKNKKNDLWKVAVHEFTHTYFKLNHCNVDTCIMKDANGHAYFSNKNNFCRKCAEQCNI